MIFMHLIVGIILGKIFGNYTLFIIGSMFPDLDHIYIILKNKLLSIKMIIETLRFEDKFGIKYKTPFFHSVFGLILFSLAAYLLNNEFIVPFGVSYLLHLLIDWLDIDEKYYLYPLKIKFKGFLPIGSRAEQILTLIAIIVVFLLYLI